MITEQRLQHLVERSRRLGSDRTICNWGGGNTSAKTTLTDFRGQSRNAIWVKSSGFDLAEATERSFTPLFLDDLLLLRERTSLTDEEMVDYLAHCLATPTAPRPSIETLLHAFLPFRHVDHTHPDAILAIACSEQGEQATQEIFGDEAIWVEYLRPGFALSKIIAERVAANPQARLVVMAKHGLITWGDTSQEAEHNLRETLQRASRYLNARRPAVPYGGEAVAPLAEADRRQMAAAVAPQLRKLLSAPLRQILHFDDSPEVLAFVSAKCGERLAAEGAACPDHVLHTKWKPLWIPWQPGGSAESLQAAVADALPSFAAGYTEYWRSFVGEAAAKASPLPHVILIPGVGMFTAGRDKRAAEITAQLFHRFLAASAGAEALGGYVSLTPAEACAIEFWPLEQYKLTLRPPERELARRVALVTGAAGGIGRAIAFRLARDGAAVVVADKNREGAAEVAAELCRLHGAGAAMPLSMDVTRENDVADGFRSVALTYGGIDIVVSNAGLARSRPIDETPIEEWQLLMDVLATGYFLVSREAFRHWKQQGMGGNLIFVGSKNSLVGGANVAAYSAAKGSEVQLARCLAQEGGPQGIRVNTVCPDAVIQGTAIFNAAWRAERCRAYGISDDQLEEYYRQRTVLKVNIVPDDIAETVNFLASERSAKTTGCIITVDGGVQAAYTR